MQNSSPMPVGRPRTNKKDIAIYDTALYQLLKKKMPHLVITRRSGGEELLDVVTLALNIGVSNKACYGWMRGARMSSSSAQALIKESRGKLKPADLADFYL